MDLLKEPSRYLFFTGKGGVGKTSLSCASAVALADRGKRVLLVSTDPASNLDQVLGTTIGGDPTPIPSVPGLLAVNIDPERAAQEYRERIIGPYRNELPPSLLNQMEEQLSGACTVEIAAFDEFTAFLSGDTATAEFDHVVFDTAPTGHTLRLLNLPAAWTGFLDNNTRGVSCLGPTSGLQGQRERYAQAVGALSDARLTTLVLVSRPDRSALAEAAVSGEELRELGLNNQHLMLNGLFRAGANPDNTAASFQARCDEALQNMPDSLQQLPTTEVLLKGHNLVGIAALRELYSAPSAATEIPMSAPVAPQIDLPPLTELVDELAKAGRGLIMVMGKGGVGKTTIAASVAIELASRGFPVHLSTTDPAAHIEQTVAGSLEGLTISRIDPDVEVEAYTQRVLATKGKGLDAQGLALLEEDLRSPCTQEVAVFGAFSRVVSKARTGFVVLDTAPTGHTLLLLDTADAYHREIVRGTGSGASTTKSTYTTPLMRLQDADYTKILIATLAETTPVTEAGRLQDDLRRAGIEPFAWVVNQSLAATGTSDPVLLQRCASEFEQIEQVRTRLAKQMFVVPWMPEPPVGLAGLGAFVRGSAEQASVPANA